MQKLYIAVAVAALTLSALACGGSGGLGTGGGDFEEELVIPVGSSTGDWNTIGDYEIEGTVSNVGDHRWEYVEISAVAYDQSGNVIGIDTTYADPEHIDPGDKSVFKLWIDDEDHETTRYEVEVADAELGS